jgi:N-acetylglucosamine-6-phosphate deacetylase
MKPFDIQVNGYAGVDFNGDDLTAEDFEKACACLREDGVEIVLATFITDEVDTMCRRFRRLVELREKSDLAKAMIAGIHIEGPFINGAVGFVGAHPATAVRPADVETMKKLLEAAGGLARIVTLAPEHDDGAKVTRFLAGEGICVSAGHCDASLDELKAGIDAGLRMFTHVGNGCPVEMHRHDNIVQRALSLSEDLWLCFIPDGWHVPFTALGNYLRCAGVERSIFVTDAISAARLGPGTYGIGEQRIEIGEDGIAWAAGGKNFAGSTVTMPRILENIQVGLGLSEEEAEVLTVLNPRKALGME